MNVCSATEPQKKPPKEKFLFPQHPYRREGQERHLLERRRKTPGKRAGSPADIPENKVRENRSEQGVRSLPPTKHIQFFLRKNICLVPTTNSCLWQCFTEFIHEIHKFCLFVVLTGHDLNDTIHLPSSTIRSTRKRHQVLTDSCTGFCWSSSTSCFSSFPSTFSTWGRIPSRFSSKPSLVADLITNLLTMGSRKQRAPPHWSLQPFPCLQADCSQQMLFVQPVKEHHKNQAWHSKPALLRPGKLILTKLGSCNLHLKSLSKKKYHPFLHLLFIFQVKSSPLQFLFGLLKACVLGFLWSGLCSCY